MDSERDPARSDARQDRREARAASAQMREDLQELRSIRNHLYFAATVSLVGTAVMSAQAWSTQESEWGGAAGLALLGTFGVITLGAILIVERWPVPVTLGLALFSTLGAVSAVWAALVRSEYRHLQHLLYSLYFWGVYVDARRLVRLAKEHPDSYSSQKMRAAGGDESSGYRAQSLEAHRRFKLLERRAVLVLFVVLIGLLVAGGLGLARNG